MENIKVKKVGRPPIYIEKSILLKEIEKYKNGQKAIETYRNLDIGKTSFYRILQKMGVSR